MCHGNFSRVLCQRMKKVRKVYFALAGVSLLVGVLLLAAEWKQETDIEATRKTNSFVVERRLEPPPLPPVKLNENLGPAGLSDPNQEFMRLWNYIYVTQYECKDKEVLGGRVRNGVEDGDGSYEVCVEDFFRPYPSPGQEPSKPCLVYSFGIGKDFSFDDAMATRGCEVHSFDPSIKVVDGLVRDSGVTFHKVGISKIDSDSNVNGWKMRTLATLMKELGHQGRYIDYLKVDTDNPAGGGFEQEIIQEMLDTGLYKSVRQFGLEIHLPGPIKSPKWLERCRLIYRQMTQLNKHGYRLIGTTDNVRYERIVSDPDFSQERKKKVIVNTSATILWEVVLVNFQPKLVWTY